MKACLHLTDLNTVKRELLQSLPGVKSSHRAEAMARGLGFGSNAALRTALAFGPIEQEIDGVAFVDYLTVHGFAGVERAVLPNALIRTGCAFPPISELPAVIDASDWTWKPFEDRFHMATGWLGTDREGHVWLVKVRGSRYAYREAVFARIAQLLGWSHQSSVFAIIPDDAEPRKGARKGDYGSEAVQGASWFLQEHVRRPCRAECPRTHFVEQYNQATDRAQFLANLGIPHALDWIRAEVASHLFGANEMSQIMFTAGHRMVLIDSEQLFSSRPIDPATISWWKKEDGTVSDTAFKVTLEVCKAVAALTDKELELCLAIPNGIVVGRSEEIRDIAFAGRALAAEFANFWELR